VLLDLEFNTEVLSLSFNDHIVSDSLWCLWYN